MPAHIPDPVLGTFRAAVERMGLLARWTELRAQALPVFAVEVTPGDVTSPTGSQLGGRPALPRSECWPTRDGKALTLVGQLDLSSFTAADVGLPTPGLLAFFVGVDEPAMDVEHEVLYFSDPGVLHQCAPPVPEFRNDNQPTFSRCV